MDVADRFVHDAVRAFAVGSGCPPVPEGTEWLHRAHAAGVVAPVVSLLTRHGHPTPAPVSGALVGAAARHLLTLSELDVVRRGVGDVPWAVLKGPVLRSVVYPRSDARDYADLDVLVPPAQLRTVLEGLLGAGARFRDADIPLAVAHRSAEIGLLLPRGTMLDLHWNVVNAGAVRDRLPVPTSDLLSHRDERTVDGHRFPTLSDADLVLHTALHACLAGGSQLRWLLDVHQSLRWLEARPGAAGLPDRARELGLTLPAWVAASLAQRHVDPSLDPADFLGGRPAWAAAAMSMTASRPTSAPSAGTRSPAPVVAATRATNRASGAALLRSAGQRAVGAPSTPVDRRPVSLGDPALQQWVAQAEAVRESLARA